MPGDLHWGWLSAGLHLAGSNGSTSFPDVKGGSFTRTGSVAISTAQSRFASEGACYFPGGASDRLVCADTPRFDMGGGAISLSFSLRPDELPVGNTIRLVMIGGSGSPSTLAIEIYPSGALGCGRPSPGQQWIIGGGAVVAGVWQDIEVSIFNGGYAYLFKNGTLIASQTGVNMPTSITSNRMLIGSDDAGVPGFTARYKGYLSELRIMAKSGRHASDFTPESGPFPEGLDLHAVRADPPKVLLASTPALWKAAVRPNPVLFMDTEHGGRGRVIGTTKNTGIPDYPVSRRVRLARKRDGVLARETWSDAAGNYLFEHVRHDIEYVVTAHDHTGLYNAVIADSVTPELMP